MSASELPPLRISLLRKEGFVDLDASTSIDDILSELESENAWQLCVAPIDEFPQFPRMHIDWQRGHGFVVMAFEDERSIGFYPIVGVKTGSPEVEVELGGQALEKWPRELFVPKATASQALRTFLSTGHHDHAFVWVANNAFKRKIIWEDRAGRTAWEKKSRTHET